MNPPAAALAYGLNKLKEKSKIAVYDLWGVTFDLSILELNEGIFQELATNGNTRLGGDDLDKRIVQFLAEQINRNSTLRCLDDLKIFSRLREVAEAAKIKLSSEIETEILTTFPDARFLLQLQAHACRVGRSDSRHHCSHATALACAHSRMRNWRQKI